ncbi:ferredoxin--NADP reductase [Williamsia phyllosphaerae]|uniref:3-ketosteroid-9-alpha-monooxygenase, ferredoxin reductase component n=1 Tax=Williamsia phyllosphaerae TaxID=885042 RepID=A0ABQ1UJ72_9NOCA|nr:ferredoxin--NADP reductase [Williamsia phyllosphaerae]GGF18043.1 3-ketosteroid-9-alpha-monooxygenase, ferredoxin reductase component [Williamsia phyllosphaerae]
MGPSPESAGDAPSRTSGRLQLQVREVIRETADAASVVFEAPDDGFSYRPGQFITVGAQLPDGMAPRCYSLSSAPGHDPHPAITVKRVPGGQVSNWLIDHATPGMSVDIIPPTGAFTPREWTDDFVVVAAGSGITPAMSIIKTALMTHDNAVTLIYANRDEQSVIFAAAIAELQDAYPERFVVRHWLESERGLPTAAELTPLVAGDGANRVAYLCGPTPFMDVAHAALDAAGLPSTQIHRELFYSLTTNPFSAAAATTTATPAARSAPPEDGVRVTVDIEGETHEVAWPRDAFLLDALLDNGIEAPYVCREGNCGGCEYILTEGEVEMRVNDTLDDFDLRRGARLACQSTPVSDVIAITYD